MEKETLFYSVVVPIHIYTGAVLLAKRKEDGIWTTPAGGGHEGETPEECAVREAWEESQLVISKEHLTPLGTVRAGNGKAVHCFLACVDQYRTDVSSDPDKEVKSWCWYMPNEFPKEMSTEKQKNRLETINKAYIKFAEIQEAAMLKKSMVQMAKLSDGGDLNTADFALENYVTDHDLVRKIIDPMVNFQIGDAPVMIPFERACLYLTKMDSGLYSGFATVSDGTLEDSANVRIERQTALNVANLVLAKGWNEPFTLPVVEEPAIEESNVSVGSSGESVCSVKAEQDQLAHKLIDIFDRILRIGV